MKKLILTSLTVLVLSSAYGKLLNFISKCTEAEKHEVDLINTGARFFFKETNTSDSLGVFQIQELVSNFDAKPILDNVNYTQFTISVNQDTKIQNVDNLPENFYKIVGYYYFLVNHLKWDENVALYALSEYSKNLNEITLGFPFKNLNSKLLKVEIGMKTSLYIEVTAYKYPTSLPIPNKPLREIARDTMAVKSNFDDEDKRQSPKIKFEIFSTDNLEVGKVLTTYSIAKQSIDLGFMKMEGNTLKFSLNVVHWGNERDMLEIIRYAYLIGLGLNETDIEAAMDKLEADKSKNHGKTAVTIYNDGNFPDLEFIDMGESGFENLDLMTIEYGDITGNYTYNGTL